MKIVCKHPTVFRDYLIEEKYEAGIVLKGSEVKSLREGKASIKESFGIIRDGEVYIINSYIAPYEAANIFNHDPRRERKLLLKKGEIRRLIGKTQIRGYTLVPTMLYFKNGKAKVELALAKGKAKSDKRQDIRRKEAEREMERALKRSY